MGYRSDVKVLVYVPGWISPDEKEMTPEQRQEKFDALKLLLKTRFAHIDAEWGGEMEFFDDTLECTFECVKWYPDYKAVQEFEAFLKSLHDLGYAYEFGRIGEDTEDVEFQRSHNSDGRLGVTRSFTW